MRDLGAEVRLVGRDFDAAKEAALAYAEERGATFVEDGREPEITEGAGTIALECLEAGVSADTAVVPVGNGALIGGMGLWLRHAAPEMTLVGVVARAAPVMRRAFESGDASPAETPPATIADGIAVRVPVPEAIPLMQRVVDEVVEVGEASLRAAVRRLHRTLGARGGAGGGPPGSQRSSSTRTVSGAARSSPRSAAATPIRRCSLRTADERVAARAGPPARPLAGERERRGGDRDDLGRRRAPAPGSWPAVAMPPTRRWPRCWRRGWWSRP